MLIGLEMNKYTSKEAPCPLLQVVSRAIVSPLLSIREGSPNWHRSGGGTNLVKVARVYTLFATFKTCRFANERRDEIEKKNVKQQVQFVDRASSSKFAKLVFLQFRMCMR